MIRKTIMTALLVLTSTAAFATDTVELTDENTAHIRELLTAQGYEVAKIKLEDGMYEAYARKDGEKYEVFLDGAFGIVRTELDD